MIEKKVYEVISKSLNIEPALLHEELGPGDMSEWDSLGHQTLIADLERHFQVKLDIDEVLDMETVGDIVEILQEKMTVI